MTAQTRSIELYHIGLRFARKTESKSNFPMVAWLRTTPAFFWKSFQKSAPLYSQYAKNKKCGVAAANPFFWVDRQNGISTA